MANTLLEWADYFQMCFCSLSYREKVIKIFSKTYRINSLKWTGISSLYLISIPMLMKNICFTVGNTWAKRVSPHFFKLITLLIKLINFCREISLQTTTLHLPSFPHLKWFFPEKKCRVIFRGEYFASHFGMFSSVRMGSFYEWTLCWKVIF